MNSISNLKQDNVNDITDDQCRVKPVNNNKE